MTFDSDFETKVMSLCEVEGVIPKKKAKSKIDNSSSVDDTANLSFKRELDGMIEGELPPDISRISNSSE